MEHPTIAQTQVAYVVIAKGLFHRETDHYIWEFLEKIFFHINNKSLSYMFLEVFMSGESHHTTMTIS